MHYLNSSYTTSFNLKRKRSGHLFQGRFKAILVEAENYLLELSRHLHLNPIRAGIVKLPEQYPYSSYSAYVFSDRQDIVTRNLSTSGTSKICSRLAVRSGRDPELRKQIQGIETRLSRVNV